MKFLIDNALSVIVSDGLKTNGHDSVHVKEYQLEKASDEIIFDCAKKEDRIIISADTDFGTLLANRTEPKPSVILFRHGANRHPEKQLNLLLLNLPALDNDLVKGSIIVFDESRIRVRSLPIIK